MSGFVLEGRVAAATLLSPFADGPFTPAVSHAEFAPLLLALADPARQAVQPPRARERGAPVDVRAPAPKAAAQATRARVEEHSAQAAATGPVRTLVVWAELSPETLRAFPAALAAFGAGMAVRPGLWLLQARTSPAMLRNLLSRQLGPSDRLLVVEAALDQAAWFNLEPGRDRELRRLWTVAAKAG